MSIGINDLSLSLRNILSKFGQGAFMLTHSTTQAPNATTNTALAFDTTDLDLCSWTASGVYTPKQPGYYLFFASLYVNAGDADFTENSSYIKIWVRKNATAAIPLHAGVSAKKGDQVHYVGILEANGTTDYFDTCVYHTAAGALTLEVPVFGGVFVSYNNP